MCDFFGVVSLERKSERNPDAGNIPSLLVMFTSRISYALEYSQVLELIRNTVEPA